MVILKNSPQYISLAATVAGTAVPTNEALLYGTVNIPTRCPFHCPHCALNSGCPNAPVRPVLTPIERSETIAKMAEAGIKSLVIIGEGEPLWQPADGTPGFEELVRPVLERANSLGMGTIMFTTLGHLTREQAEILRDNNVSVFVSLHSLKDETYRRSTGNGDLAKVLQNIEILRAVYGENEEIDGQEVTRLGINFTITLLNESEVESVRNFAHEHGMQFICNPLMPSGRAANKNVWDKRAGSPADFARMAALATRYSDTGGQSSIKAGRCSYGYRGIAIDVGGRLMICGYKPGPEGCMPNIMDMSANDILRFHRLTIQGCWDRSQTGEGCHCITRASAGYQARLEQAVRDQLKSEQ